MNCLFLSINSSVSELGDGKVVCQQNVCEAFSRGRIKMNWECECECGSECEPRKMFGKM